MFVCFEFVSSVINLICLMQLVLFYIVQVAGTDKVYMLQCKLLSQKSFMVHSLFILMVRMEKIKGILAAIIKHMLVPLP